MYNKIYYFCQNRIGMKKITEIIGSVDEVYLDKLIYLDRLLKLYAKFMKDYHDAYVRVDGEKIFVRFSKINNYGYMNWTEREFTVEELPERINKYREKIKYEFKNRHANTRLLREKEIIKWKKIIEDAKIQMSE